MRMQRHHGNLFVANLPVNFQEERLAETFDPYGIVLSAEVARDPATGARLRYGWVDIATERAAAGAISALHGSEIDGCRIEVRPSEKPARKGPAAPRKGSAVAPRRAAPAANYPRRAADGNAEAPAIPTPRPRPQFQVERRSLPRRV